MDRMIYCCKSIGNSSFELSLLFTTVEKTANQSNEPRTFPEIYQSQK